MINHIYWIQIRLSHIAYSYISWWFPLCCLRYPITNTVSLYLSKFLPWETLSPFIYNYWSLAEQLNQSLFINKYPNPLTHNQSFNGIHSYSPFLFGIGPIWAIEPTPLPTSNIYFSLSWREGWNKTKSGVIKHNWSLQYAQQETLISIELWAVMY